MAQGGYGNWVTTLVRKTPFPKEEISQIKRLAVAGRSSSKRLSLPIFETIHFTLYSPRRVQQVVKETAAEAKIEKRVYPYLLRHSVATTLLERGMSLEQIQKFLGHSKLETTQIYAESTPEMIKESYQRALGG